MRIAQINTTYGTADSTGRTTKEMHKWLCSHGFDSVAFCTECGEDSKSEVYCFSGKMAQKVHGLLSRITGMQGYFSYCSTKHMVRLLQNMDVDVVILRVIHSNNINLPILFDFLRSNQIITFIVLHDFWFMTGHCMYPIRHQCKRWISCCKKCPARKEDNASWFLDKSARCYRDKLKWVHGLDKLHVIGVSDWVANEARKSGILKDAKSIDRIYNWIDMSTFFPKDSRVLRGDYGIDKNRAVVLAVSTLWGKTKGLPLINRMALQLNNVQIIVIGRVSENEKIEKGITYIGVVHDTKELADYYAMADVFVNPSIHETFGKTTAEAMCCGTPVVCYDTSACRELVGSERGIVVPSDNQKAFVDGVRRILEQGKGKYSEACRKFCEKEFSMDINISKYIDIIQKDGKLG